METLMTTMTPTVTSAATTMYDGDEHLNEPDHGNGNNATQRQYDKRPLSSTLPLVYRLSNKPGKIGNTRHDPSPALGTINSA
jgi:hypothetical protein